MVKENLVEMRSKHEVMAELSYEPSEIRKGYNNRFLRVDLGSKAIQIEPVTEQMKELWIGGKGFDLWLTFLEITADTKWDSPENPICFSPGPLGGTASFPGTGKTLVTAISPMTHSMMDSNVGGYFGPYLKFAGFDAMKIVGKAEEEIVDVIDSTNNRITIEAAPLESIDSHLVAEELTEMYADDEIDKQNIAVVSAGRAADHIRMGLLNFSFYDWRRKVPRLKQAGRGGIGTVFPNKKIKAIVIKNQKFVPSWKVSQNKAASRFVQKPTDEPAADIDAIRGIILKWNRDPEFVIEMMQDIQEHERHISRVAINELNSATGTSRAELYHIATFYKTFSLEPKGETIIQVCVGTACHVRGSDKILEAFERELDVPRGGTTRDRKFSLEAVACLGCCSLAPVVKVGEAVFGDVRAKDIRGIIEGERDENIDKGK